MVGDQTPADWPLGKVVVSVVVMLVIAVVLGVAVAVVTLARILVVI